MIYISIGSNLGHRLHYLQTALVYLNQNGFRIIKKSPVIETAPLLPPNAALEWHDKPYLNMVVAGEFNASLENLLTIIKNIEQRMGRLIPAKRWAPRIIDLDILLADDQVVDSEALHVPHPELLNRPFLIHLLALMAPELKYPQTQKTFTEIAYTAPGMESCYDYSIVVEPKLVGIVNVTPDSFSDGGQFFSVEKALKQALMLHEQGASVLDIGAQSTNPRADMITAEEELQRLKPVLDALQPIICEKQLLISIDSFTEETVRYCLAHYPIHWVNDVKGVLSQSCLEDIAAQGCQLVVNHSLSMPPSQMNVIPFNLAAITTMSHWAQEKITELLQRGFTQQQIIIDPGIGYGKTPYQNIVLLQQIAQLKKFGCKILVGHSRKLFMNLFNHFLPKDRDIETLAISQILAEQGVDYLRVHNVQAHQRFFVARSIAKLT
jgi:2-amino-4-hydroxy-6-hydroxymethyldihydropteridine diphosphokinase / dihydropteroate synthase